MTLRCVHPRMRAGTTAACVVVLILMMSLPPHAEATPEVPKTLRLEDAQRAAQVANPHRIAATWQVKSAQGHAEDQAKWPNPLLDAELENWGTSRGNDIIESTLGVSQRFEVGGDRGARADLATSYTQVARAELASLDRDLWHQVAIDFVAAWVAQERLWMLREAQRIADAAVGAAQERITAGAAPPVEKIRARSILALVTAEVIRADAKFHAARRELALRWGSAEPAFDSLYLPPADLASWESDDAALTSHPAVLGAEAELGAAEALVRTARAERVPDVDLRFAVRRVAELDATAFVAGVTFPIPVWNARSGDIASAEAGQARLQARRSAVDQQLRAEHASALGALQAASRAHEALARDALPAAEEALDMLQSGYRSGRYSYVDLLEGQRAALEASLATVDSAAEVWRAVARLESLTGATDSVGGAP